MIAPRNLGPLLGAFSCLRHQALSIGLGRFGLTYTSRLGTWGAQGRAIHLQADQEQCCREHHVKNDEQATGGDVSASHVAQKACDGRVKEMHSTLHGLQTKAKVNKKQ